MKDNVKYPFFKKLLAKHSEDEEQEDVETSLQAFIDDVRQISELVRNDVKLYAPLRQCSKLEEITSTSAFWKVKFCLQKFLSLKACWQDEALAIWCRILPEIRKDIPEIDFVASLGSNKTSNNEYVISEQRFRQILCSPNIDIFLSEILSCIRRLHGNVNVVSLLDYIFLWCRDNDGYAFGSKGIYQVRQTANFIWSESFFSSRSK